MNKLLNNPVVPFKAMSLSAIKVTSFAFVVLVALLSATVKVNAQTPSIAWQYRDASHFPPERGAGYPWGNWTFVNNTEVDLLGYAREQTAIRRGTNAKVFLVQNHGYGWLWSYTKDGKTYTQGFNLVDVAAYQGRRNGLQTSNGAASNYMVNWGIYTLNVRSPNSWRAAYWIRNARTTP